MKILNNATINNILTGSLLGNASTSTKLATARTIALTGDVTGSASFDGSANATITAVVADDSHNHIISNVDNLQSTLDSKAPMATITATLPATAGWYRIATSAVGINRCSARFEIDWTLSGIHGQVILNAGIMYNEDQTLNQVQYVHYTGNGLTKARIVYHTTYAGNYAYLEVYNNSASALVVTAQMFSTLGWTLVSPSTVGSIPTGYTSIQMDFVDGFSTEGVFKSSIATGTAPLTVASSTNVTNLNADLLDGYHATTSSQANTIAVSDANNNITATKFTGALAGNATTATTATSATKLATARNIALVGDVTGNVNFDGSSNVSITTNVDPLQHTHGVEEVFPLYNTNSSGTTYINQYTKIARISIPSAWNACSGKLDFLDAEDRKMNGRLYFYFRMGANVTTLATSVLQWETLSDPSYADSVHAVKVSDGVFDLYFKSKSSWQVTKFGKSGAVTNPNALTLYSSQAYVASITSILTSSYNDVATKLATPRTISLVGDVTGSVSFDGSANASITTVLAAGGAMNVLQFLNSAEIAQVKGNDAPTLDMSVNVQAYIDASRAVGANKLYFPKGKYRFKNINLYDFSCAIEGEILIAGNVTNTAFFLPATQDALFFYGTQDTISFSGIAFVSEGTYNDGKNTSVYKMNRLVGSSISVNNVYMTGFSGKGFDTVALIDSNFTNFNADYCYMPVSIVKGEWPVSTTVTLDKWYIRNCNYGIQANYCGQSRATDVIIEWCFTKAMDIQNGSWTFENLYLENNNYGVDATNTQLSISSVYSYLQFAGDAIHNDQPDMPYFDRGTSSYGYRGAKITRLEYEYIAPKNVIDSAGQTSDTWWEVGEWIGGNGGSNIEIEFRGASNFWQNTAGDGVWNTVGKTVVRATIGDNKLSNVPNINAYMYQEGHGTVKRVKIVANNPERTAFKIYALVGQYSPRLVVEPKISLGYWLTYANSGVADPGSASANVVDVVNSFKIVMASDGYFRVKESGTLDLKTVDATRGSTSMPSTYAKGMPIIFNGVQYYVPLLT